MVALYVVDDLHNGAVGRGGIVEHEGAALAHHRKPLPVGVLLGGEGIEERMFRTGEDAQCAGRHLSFVVLADGLEHAVVPIVGLEERSHRIGAARGAVGHEEHPGALLQLPGHIVGQLPGYQDALFKRFQRFLLGIYPDRPTVADLAVGYPCSEIIAAGGVGQRGERYGEGSHAVESFSHVKWGRAARYIIPLPVRKRPAQGSCQWVAAVVGHLYLAAQGLIGGIAHLLRLQQRHHLRAPLPPLARRGQAL